MHVLLFLKGVATGLIISIPLGPMALICIRRTLNQGYLTGLVTAFGIALADSIYASIAGFGVGFIIDQIREHEKLVGLLGGIIITVLGLIMIISQTRTKPKEKLTAAPFSLFRSFYTAILLTLSNPITLLALIALFSWIGALKDQTLFDTWLIVLGVFMGALTWFNLLALFSSILKSKLKPEVINIVHRVTGILIIIIGIIMTLKML